MPHVGPPTWGSNHDEAAFAALASAAVRQATTFFCLCDAGLRPFFLNAAGRAMIGLTEHAEIAEYTIPDFVTPEHRSTVSDVALPMLMREGGWEGELSLRHFGDPTREIEVRWVTSALRDPAGALIGAVAFTTDSADCRAAERALRGQQMLLASMLDNLPLGVGMYDRHGDLIHSNQRLRDYGGLTRLPSGTPAASQRWHGYDAAGKPMQVDRYPGLRALRGESVAHGIDFLYDVDDAPARWMRVSAVPVRREAEEANEALVVVQDVDDLKQAAGRIATAAAALARQSRFLETTLSSIPDFVYAFDRQRRFAYANAAMLGLFGLSADEMLGRTLAELDYPVELTDRLNGHIDRVLSEGVTVEDEVFFESPTGRSAYFDFVWGPVRAEDDTVELVVGVSRDTSERRAFEQALSEKEARLRAASELVGLGVYSWNPVSNALEWDERLREMWGVQADSEVDMQVFTAGIHPDDRARVEQAIAACIDPAGEGRYAIEYRVIGRDDQRVRHIATSGRTTFVQGRAVGFIGAAIDVTARRRNEAAVRASEAQFRSFAEHSSRLIWIVDPEAGAIIYRSAAFERIWGISCEEAPAAVSEWMKGVHPEDRQQVEHALDSVRSGKVVQFEYRIVRPADGTIRWLRDTSFPIPDDDGTVTRIGGITDDLTPENIRQVYIVSGKAAEARKLATLVRGLGCRARTFENAARFLDMAPVLAPGCVLVDLRKARDEGLSIPRELRAHSVTLPAIALDAADADVSAAVAAMRAGAIDYVVVGDEATLGARLAHAVAECHATARPTTRDENAGARVARLTPREREVLLGLVEGGTNKMIGKKLGISPRTVELHRAQVMSRLNASNLTELLQIALSAGMSPSTGERWRERQPT